MIYSSAPYSFIIITSSSIKAPVTFCLIEFDRFTSLKRESSHVTNWKQKMHNFCMNELYSGSNPSFVAQKANILSTIHHRCIYIVQKVCVPPPPPPPLTVKSDSFLLQLDGKYEDCWTKKKMIQNYYSLNEGRHRNRVIVHCFLWRCRHFTMVTIVIMSSYRCRAW